MPITNMILWGLCIYLSFLCCLVLKDSKKASLELNDIKNYLLNATNFLYIINIIDSCHTLDQVVFCQGWLDQLKIHYPKETDSLEALTVRLEGQTAYISEESVKEYGHTGIFNETH